MADEHDKINEIADRHADRCRERMMDDFVFLVQHSESPIEKIFGAALVAALREIPEMEFDVRAAGNAGPRGSDNFFLAQAPLNDGRYRVDFLVVCSTEGKRPPVRIAIECDGHDYHERTKEQAARDRQKDRWMQVNSISIMRFTGSEIWCDARKCAGQVAALIYQRVFFS